MALFKQLEKQKEVGDGWIKAIGSECRDLIMNDGVGWGVGRPASYFQNSRKLV